ncbi:hypothetical protein G3N59_16465 [Paraburkholderia sp. Ac-20340]|uniref:hypothetical protein n=1 Tax=Paraburkholderia sp. Ac-20340 TaxID=2703888 RepID=UPI00198000CF|nr:hypothetical protein [Paraburkholderia sp. Ac-20340]MBN3854977.1 hypothetical protein [Paraburkholderia sp. Ac-20340]
MEVPAKAVMSPEQQADLLQYMRTGLEWASGDISLDDVMKRLGSPKRRTEFNNDIEYKWFPYNLMTISFAYRKHQAGDETPSR